MPGRRERITFNRRTAKRIATVVTNAERGNRNMSPIRFRTAAGDEGGGAAIKLGRVSVDWFIGDVAVVAELDVNGNPKPGGTFTAKNWLVPVIQSGFNSTRKVVCAEVDGQWILIAVECVL